MIIQDALALSRQIIDWRRALHRIPEVGIELPRTRAFICGVLENMGVSCRLHTETSGIESLITGRRGGTIAIRSDMDALPIKERTGLPFASANGCMHACGHDANAAMALGAMRLLLERKEELNGSVKFIFQPGEEDGEGAKHMLNEGVLENPRVDAVLGIHLSNSLPELGPGEIGIKPGALMAGADTFSILIEGKGGHIAAPAHAKNPIIAAAEIIAGLYEEKEPTFDMSEAVMAIGSVHSGERPNIIPETARLEGTFRAMEGKTRNNLRDWLEEVCGRASANTGAGILISWEGSCDVVYNDEELTKSVGNSAKKLFPEGFATLRSKIMAGDDISVFFSARKGCYIHLGCGFKDGREIFALHNARFAPNESILWRGSAILAQSALDWLNDNSADSV